MSFTDFHGNSDLVDRLREMVARDRFPQAVVLAGPAGSGKYTLVLMLAKAIKKTGRPMLAFLNHPNRRIGDAKFLRPMKFFLLL